MTRPSQDVVKALASASRRHPEIVQWLDGWYAKELGALPYAAGNTALAQGRCQVLKEVSDLVRSAPENAHR